MHTTLNQLNRLLSQTLVIIILFCSFSTRANDPFAAAVVEDDFLPVAEAYQVIIEADSDKFTLNWSIAPGYYLYQHQFSLVAQNHSTEEKLELQFQPGKKKYDDYFEKELDVYYYNTLVQSEKTSLSPPFELVVKSQGCADAGLCYPPRRQYFQVSKDNAGKISLIETESSQIPDNEEIPSEGNDLSRDLAHIDNSEAPFLPLVLVMAILGGLILNLMPCVFPVLSLKAMSFTSSQLTNDKQHLHGWAYTLGVVGSFVVAALFIIIARQTGNMLGWGFQLQHPTFVALMAYLFFVMGLSLSGFLEIGTRWMGAGQSLTSGQGLKSSFFTGILAALVASPCTAPFMASALGFALTQPAYISLLVFVALGFGMALPFLALSYSPALAKFLPAPGAWMDTLKQFLAFPLYATSVWLLWVLGHQATSDGAALVAFGAVLISFAIWLIKLAPQKAQNKLLVKSLATAGFGFALLIALKVASVKETLADTPWETYSAAKLEQLRNENVPIFLDLTADWCITCKVNESVALNTENFVRTAREKGITLLQGDWTNANPEITAILKQFGRSGVPLYVVYPADPAMQPEVLPQILTESIAIDALERAVP